MIRAELLLSQLVACKKSCSTEVAKKKKRLPTVAGQYNGKIAQEGVI